MLILLGFCIEPNLHSRRVSRVSAVLASCWGFEPGHLHHFIPLAQHLEKCWDYNQKKCSMADR